MKNRRSKGISDNVLAGNRNLIKAYAMAKSLPLLPAEDFERGIQVVIETANDNGVTDPRFIEFVNYIRQTWLPSML